jgi:phage shock protein PspC (stress-responsive transcriptional regulator)
MQKKLYRSANDKKIAGVCGGLAKYLNIDVTVIRVIWALIALGGAGILAYIVCALIIPEEPSGYIDAF